MGFRKVCIIINQYEYIMYYINTDQQKKCGVSIAFVLNTKLNLNMLSVDISTYFNVPKLWNKHLKYLVFKKDTDLMGRGVHKNDFYLHVRQSVPIQWPFQCFIASEPSVYIQIHVLCIIQVQISNGNVVCLMLSIRRYYNL